MRVLDSSCGGSALARPVFFFLFFFFLLFLDIFVFLFIEVLLLPPSSIPLVKIRDDRKGTVVPGTDAGEACEIVFLVVRHAPCDAGRGCACGGGGGGGGNRAF